MVAQARDPHKKQRRTLQALYTQLPARDEYKRAEAAVRRAPEMPEAPSGQSGTATGAEQQETHRRRESEEAAASAEKGQL